MNSNVNIYTVKDEGIQSHSRVHFSNPALYLHDDRQRPVGARTGRRDRARVKGAESIGVRAGNWLSLKQAEALLNAPDITTAKGLPEAATVSGNHSE